MPKQPNNPRSKVTARNPFAEGEIDTKGGRTIEMYMPPGPTGRHLTEWESATMRQIIITRRMERVPFQKIAEELGISATAVHKHYAAAMHDIPAVVADIYRREQLDILDKVEAKALMLLDRVHFAHSNGRVVVWYDEKRDEEVPLEDSMPVLAAIKTIVDIEQRKAKLLGLDQPIKIDASLTEVTATDIEIAQMIQQIEGRNQREKALIEERTEADDRA